MRSTPPGDQIDLNQRVVRQPRDPNTGAGRQPPRREEPLIRGIERGVVLFETGQVSPNHHHIRPPKTDSAKNRREVIHYVYRLALDALRQSAWSIRRVGHLPGDEDEATGFRRVAERCDGPGSALDHVELDVCIGHKRVLRCNLSGT